MLDTLPWDALTHVVAQCLTWKSTMAAWDAILALTSVSTTVSCVARTYLHCLTSARDPPLQLIPLLTSLETISFDGHTCVVDDLMLATICAPHTLRHISLRNCSRVTDCAVTHLCARHPVIWSLELVECHQVACIPQSHPSLTHVDASGCFLVNVAPLHLHSLSLCGCWNVVTSSIDTFVSHKMHTLNLSGCTISSIESLRHCVHLVHLDMSTCCEVTDISPLCSCTLLAHVNFGRCYGVTDFTPFLQGPAASTLRDLNLDYCINVDAVGGVGPKLETLSLKRCNVLDASIVRKVVTSNCSTLQMLDLFLCTQIVDLQSITRGCPLLTSLAIGRCDQVADVEAALKSVPALSTLDMQNCNVTDDWLDALQHCPMLKRLGLMSCSEVTNVGVLRLARHCPRLVHVDLYGCDFVGDTGVIALATWCNQLEVVELYNTRVTDVGVVALSSCVHLTHVDVRHCPFVGDNGVVALAVHCPHLQRLQLYDAYNVTDVAVRTIGLKCAFLTHLSLTFSKLVTDVRCLANCTLLRTLDVYGCDVCDLTDVIARCVHLETLWVCRSEKTRTLVRLLNQSISLYPEDEWDEGGVECMF